MKILTYEVDGRKKLGIWNRDETWIYPIESFGIEYKRMREVIQGISGSEIQLLNHMASKDPYEIRGAAPTKEAKILAPIQKPGHDVICLGINYMDHAQESARYQKEAFDGERPYAVYFSKRVNRCVGHNEGIPAHQDIVDSLDYEAELAVIIGKTARNVKAENAGDYVFGYTVLNDVSARDLQTGHKQWYFGKGLDGFTPMGPCILTADETAFPPALDISCAVNGEERQRSNTALLIHGIPEIIEELSAGMTLLPGTIIATGTPAGVGMGFDPPKFLSAGDVVACTIQNVGTLRSTVR